jgi:drug/metabolite transporter (DMT)-like permease
MIIGGLPLLVLSVIKHDPAFTGSLQELDYGDWLALIYTSIFGSAISYGVYFYNATRGFLLILTFAFINEILLCYLHFYMKVVSVFKTSCNNF